MKALVTVRSLRHARHGYVCARVSVSNPCWYTVSMLGLVTVAGQRVKYELSIIMTFFS